SGKVIKRLATEHYLQLGATYFRDNERLLLLDRNALSMWDVRTGKLLPQSFGPPEPARALAFREDGRFLVSGHLGTLCLWDVQTGKSISSRSRSGKYVQIGGSTAVVGDGYPDVVTLVEVPSGKRQAEVLTRPPSKVPVRFCRKPPYLPAPLALA